MKFENIIELKAFLKTHRLLIDVSQLKLIEHEVNGISKEIEKTENFLFSFEINTYHSINKHFVFILNKEGKIEGMKSFPLLESEKQNFLIERIDNCGSLLSVNDNTSLLKKVLIFLKVSKKTNISLSDVKVGKRFQFYGDRNRVREIKKVYKEFCLIKTLGCTEDLPYYKCHYTHLKINETQAEELK